MISVCVCVIFLISITKIVCILAANVFKILHFLQHDMFSLYCVNHIIVREETKIKRKYFAKT